MFKPLSCAIGLRYTRARRRNLFISFISFSSMLGIALGVMVLITVLSVMNGFDSQIRERVFSMAPQLMVTRANAPLTDWQPLLKEIRDLPAVQQASPYVAGLGMLSFQNRASAAQIQGILPSDLKKMPGFSNKMEMGDPDALQPGRFHLLLGDELAAQLGVSVGDRVTLFIPSVSVTPVGVLPRYRACTVVGIFHIGIGFNFDNGLVFMHLRDAAALLQMGDAVTGVQATLHDMFEAPHVRQVLSEHLPMGDVVTDWTQNFGAFFRAIAMEKTMMFLILVLIIAVAAFNLVSSLVMAVTDKTAEIAILRTMGATPGLAMRIFMVQGAAIGFMGTLLGLLTGVLLAWNVTALADALQRLLGMQFLSSSVYFIDYLPSELQWSDVWHVCLVAFTLSLLATVYPAWRASRIQPVEALRYE